MDALPDLDAPSRHRDHPFARSISGLIGLGVLIVMAAACFGSLPWTLASVDGVPRYNAGSPHQARIAPAWASHDRDEIRRLNAMVDPAQLASIAKWYGMSIEELIEQTEGKAAVDLRRYHPKFRLGTDMLGRDLWARCLIGGSISLGIGIAAALISVTIGTLYGALAAYAGGRADAVMMRIVDILYGLPYILLVVLLAVAGDALLDEWVTRARAREAWVRTEAREMLVEQGHASPTRADVRTLLEDSPDLRDDLIARALVALPPREMSAATRTFFDLLTLLVAIGGVSWLTMSRVIRGQVLSLKEQPFVEAARAVGARPRRIFVRHLLPNLVGPIVVYATLTVPQAILQESFLSFLGIGVKPPLPSWGNLASDGLSEVNMYKSHWWLLLFPCLLLGVTLLALNFVGEGLREAFDPKRARR